jgi:hypothetical protein
MAYGITPKVAFGDLWTAAQHNAFIKDNFAAAIPDIFTTVGDMAYASVADAAARLAIGTNNQAFCVNSGATAPEWVTLSFVGCSVYRSSDQTGIVDSTPTNVLFNAENFDTDGFHSTSTNTDRITIPSGEDGLYLLCAMVEWIDNLGGVHAIRLKKNGTTYLGEGAGDSLVTTSTDEGTYVMAVADLDASDYVVVEGYHETVGLATLDAQDGVPYFCAAKLR